MIQTLGTRGDVQPCVALARGLERAGRQVHHGSTAAGLRAGKPTVICPFFGDQPFWGRRVAALCVGPLPVPQRHLTAERLAEAILATTDSGMRSRAEALGAAIRSEDGIAAAVTFIENHGSRAGRS